MRCSIFLYLLLTVFCVQAKVSVQINQEVFNFSENPRLVGVLAQVAVGKQWYWPASALYRLNSSRAENQRDQIIKKLESIQLSLSSADSSHVSYLIEQIKQWSIADRIPIPIDYDAAQMNANNNPQFENGEYRLELRLRPQTASIFGLTSQALTINLANNQCAHSYIQQFSSSLASNDFAYIIQPDGVSKKIGIAYWNQGCTELMPGSQIYIPLPESQFFIENSMLNAQIVALAKNRIP
ncbi:capsule biosynthesis GfcC family protein [Paraglaciecola sp.]|uniref:capsule biosynthesis GfcC family protein n=1 Tax=Paraglaciecola sp. TaxID=1920173 RepID=UPI0030F4A06A